MLSISRLVVLDLVDRHGTIVAAAHELGVTPSAVSHQLSRLEREAGVALVERGPRSVRLTEAGRRLASHARRIAEQLSAAEKEVDDLRAGGTGRLRIGFFSSGGLRLVPLALQTFTAERPGIDVDLVPGQIHELLPLIEQGDLDLAVVFDHGGMPFPVPKTLESAPLLRDPHLLLVPDDHPLAGAQRVRLVDLANQQWIATHGLPPVGSLLEKLCYAAGFTPTIRCRTDHYDVIVGLVRAGIGISMVPALGVHPGTLDGVRLLRLAGPDPVRQIAVTTRIGNPNPAVAKFVRALETAASALAAELGAVGVVLGS